MIKEFFDKLRYSKGHGGVLVRGALKAFVVKMTGAGVLFSLHVLLARLLGVEQYGIYVYVLTWINILVILCLLGFQTSLVRFIAEYNIKQQWGLLRGILRCSNQVVLSFSILVSLTGVVVIWALGGRISPEMAITFYIAFALLPFMVFCRLRAAALRALKHVARSELLLCVIRPVLTGVVVIALFHWLGDALKARYTMVANLAAIVCTAGIGTIFFHKLLPKAVGETKPDFANKQWLKISLPMLFIAGMHIILKRTDIVMLGALKGYEQAGIYSVASRVSNLVVFGLAAINIILAPMISELYSTGSKQKLQYLITLATRIIFVFTLVVSVFLGIFGSHVLSLFGTGFTDSYRSLLVLLGGQIVNSLVGSVGYIMVMSGHQNQTGLILVVSAGMNILLNFMLIPLFGLAGAAFATALSMVLWNFAMLIYVRKKLNLNPLLRVKSHNK